MTKSERFQGHLNRGECPLCYSLVNLFRSPEGLLYFVCSSGRHHYRAEPHLVGDGATPVWDGLLSAEDGGKGEKG